MLPKLNSQQSYLLLVGLLCTGAVLSAPNPTPSSGSLRGTAAELGDNGAPIDIANKAVVSDYSTVPGQSADPKLGLFLDFSNVDAPQPIRGDQGGTDPGPRQSTSCIVN